MGQVQRVGGSVVIARRPHPYRPDLVAGQLPQPGGGRRRRPRFENTQVTRHPFGIPADDALAHAVIIADTGLPEIPRPYVHAVASAGTPSFDRAPALAHAANRSPSLGGRTTIPRRSRRPVLGAGSFCSDILQGPPQR